MDTTNFAIKLEVPERLGAFYNFETRLYTTGALLEVSASSRTFRHQPPGLGDVRSKAHSHVCVRRLGLLSLADARNAREGIAHLKWTIFRTVLSYTYEYRFNIC